MALAPEPATPVPPSPPLEHLTAASRLLSGAFDLAPVGLFLAAPDGSIRWCNQTWRQQFALSEPIPVAADRWVGRLHPDDRARVTAAIRDAITEGVTVVETVRLDEPTPTDTVDAATQLTITAGRSDPDRAASGIVGAVVTRPTEPDAETSLAMHDPLTGLANRLLLLDHLAMGLSRGDRDRSHLAVLYLDVDRFKSVNDTQGHEAGDVLLVELARRIKIATRPSDTVARIGGDEFVVLLDQVDDERHALDVARRVTDAIESEPFPIPGIDLHVTVSAGLALSRSGITATELLREADVAMYRAKDKGRARLEIYDEVLRRRAERRVEVAHRLGDAIRDDQIDVHYQPIVSLRSGDVVAAEALARWSDLRPGDDFIGVALDTGLIVDLGALVLNQACIEARSWEVDRGPSSPSVHVNLASRQIGDPRIIEIVASALADSGLRPSALCLEIPEPVITDDRVAAGETLTTLHQLGVRIAIDDFGTASSSLPYLRDLPIDLIKVDRSFIEGISEDPEDSAVAAAVIGLAHTLGIGAVAEGVETVEHLAELKALECDEAHGYLFSHPLPSDQLRPYLDHVFAV